MSTTTTTTQQELGPAAWLLLPVNNVMKDVLQFVHHECCYVHILGSFLLQDMSILVTGTVEFVFLWKDYAMKRRSKPDLCYNIECCRETLLRYFARYNMRVDEDWNEFIVRLLLPPPDGPPVHKFVQYWAWDEHDESEE